MIAILKDLKYDVCLLRFFSTLMVAQWGSVHYDVSFSCVQKSLSSLTNTNLTSEEYEKIKIFINTLP